MKQRIKEMFYIQDWAGNVLNFKGLFERPQFAVAMEFEAFDDGWDYIYQHFDEETFEDLYVEKKEY